MARGLAGERGEAFLAKSLSCAPPTLRGRAARQCCAAGCEVCLWLFLTGIRHVSARVEGRSCVGEAIGWCYCKRSRAGRLRRGWNGRECQVMKRQTWWYV